MSLSAFALAALLQAASVPSPAPASALPRETRPAPPIMADTFSMVFFGTGSAAVTGQGNAILDGAANTYRGMGFATVQIFGYADEVGPSAHNMRLSARRARAVAAALVRRGIPRGVMTLTAMGETSPLVTTPHGVAEAQNRYVLVQFGPGAP
jgi:outer membrane protein OmpA-like peptidoglycan-associated protein